MVGRPRRIAIALCAAWAAAASASAQAPNAPIAAPRFESWAPLGEYERAAFEERGGLRIVVPTKQRDVEIAFIPEDVVGARYDGQRLDASGFRAGTAAPRFAAWTGEVEANAGRDFAKLGYTPANGRLEGLLRVDGAFYALEANLAAGDFTIAVREADADEIASLAKACGVLEESLPSLESGSSPMTESTPPATAAATQLREIELGTEADALFVTQQGGVADANARILSIVNMMNGIYETDLGLTSRIVSQRAHTGSDDYTTTDPDRLLEQFRAKYLREVTSSYDDALLFSGRELDGSTVGIAYLEATCTSASFGVLQMIRLSDFTRSLLAAHELGHNLGARHSSFGIMAPSLTGETFFAQASKDEIALYTGRVACLATTLESGTNSAPTLEPVGPQAVTEGDSLVLQLEANDAEGDALSYSAAPLPVGAALSPSGLFTYTPPRATAGCNASTQTNVRFSVSDGFLNASETVPIAVDDANTNSAPTLADPADRNVYVGRLVQFQLQASDVDGDTLSYSAANLPAGASLSASGGFTWTPAAEETATVTFRATDCTGLSATQSVQLAATIQPAPHLVAISQTTGWMGDTVTLTGTALSGDAVRVRFVKADATILSLSDTEVTVLVPKVKKKRRKAGPQPVTLVRDGVSADNALSFDYVKPF